MQFYFCTGKSGCNPDDCVDLARHIIEQCDKLRFCGLMTIGQINYDYSQGPNPDFQVSDNVMTNKANC